MDFSTPPYRGISEDSGKMVYGHLVMRGPWPCIRTVTGREEPVKSSTVGRFCGCTDTDGSPIYAGDMLRTDSPVCGGVDARRLVFQCVDEGSQFRMHSVGAGFGFVIGPDEFHDREFVVIGTQFDAELSSCPADRSA